MMAPKHVQSNDDGLRTSLAQIPYISPEQVEEWVSLQQTIDASRDYLIRAVPQAQQSIEEAQKILSQRTYTLVFFGGTGVGKSTLINALLGRNLLPTGAVTAVTGTIVYIERAAEGEAETLTLSYWSRGEFAARVRRLCQLAELEPFDIADDGERALALETIQSQLDGDRQEAKTERDEYLEILVDCVRTFEAQRGLFQNGPPPSRSYSLDDEEALTHLREDGFKGSAKRQIRLVKSATFRLRPTAGRPDLLMNGHLRIVDVPGLGAGMRLHEAITLEEMKREDAIIVLVADAGRQRVDEMKSLSAVHWIKENRLFGLSGADLDEAASKIFLVVNGANVRQAFDRLNAGLPESELEVKEVTRYIAPNYWERYRERGNRRPYFLVMAAPALYVEDPTHAPAEFASETERVLKVFGDQLGPVDKSDPLAPETAAAIMGLSEIPLLRERIMSYIERERVRSQLREASSRVRAALHALRLYYEKQLAGRRVHPPFNTSWEALQERRYENALVRQQKELPRAFHNALLDLSQRINSDERFRRLVMPTLNSVQGLVHDSVRQQVEDLLESYGTEHWDDRDVTFDSLIWGASGIEVPVKRILYQVELVMQEAIANFMPEVAAVVAADLERTLEVHEIATRLERAEYGQAYTYELPTAPGEDLSIGEAFQRLVGRIGANYGHICRQATMYELMKPARSIHARLEAGERELPLPEEDRLLDIILLGPEAVGQQMATREAAIAAATNSHRQAAAVPSADVVINILDAPPSDVLGIKLGLEALESGHEELEASYAAKLDSIAAKTNRIFAEVIADLFGDDELLPRLRRLFWLEATTAERDFNNHLVKPMLRQHDRRLANAELRAAMEGDLESVSDVEELMRVWEGLHRLEGQVAG
jgi:hypothetical protein